MDDVIEANYGLIREGEGHAILRKIPIPRVPYDYILVKTVAVALNPTDWTTLDAPGDSGTLVGCDYAGVIVELGEAVGQRFQKGDRVAGFGHGGTWYPLRALIVLARNDSQPENGAFAKFIAVKADLQMHIPDEMSFEAAASIGVGTFTTGYGLYKVLNLPLPDTPSESNNSTILIYGGSTATGTIAIQFARLSGLRVVTVCSPRHFDLVKSLGAHEAYDYHVDEIGKKIHNDTNGFINNVFDTVATEATAAICADAMSPSGGVYCNLLGVDCPRPDVKSVFFLGYNMSGESYVFEKEHYAAQPDDLVFAGKFGRMAEKLWADGKLMPHPQRVEAGGLLGTLSGMREMREGRVSGEKLVYRVDDTKWP